MKDKMKIPLNKIPKGSCVIIVEVPEGKGKSQLIRLGILKGELIRCLERLPGGTVVIEKNRREVAIGASLSKSILVAYTDTSQKDKSQKKHD